MTPTPQLLHDAWTALGGDPELLHLVEVTGDPAGLLPSSLAALPAMVAAVSASTLAASVLDAARHDTAPAPVSVDIEHVAVAARSERFASIDGRDPSSTLFAPLSRFWRTTDGWLRLHANYPWHRVRALELLGCDDRPEAVAAAVAGWRGADLEEALAAHGAVGYFVRTRSEWLAHPQGRAVAELPLAQVSIGSPATRPRASDPAGLAGAGRVAQGVRVLDLTRVIAGPVATRTLAAWGADVLRIDSPHLPELPSQTLDTLPGKRSALLDFATADGRARLEELLAEADVLIQGYRPGALARFGLSPGDIAERHPRLTTVTLSAWGCAGPWAERRGFDSLVQCPTGIAFAEGTAVQAATTAFDNSTDRPEVTTFDHATFRPGALPSQVLDHATGYLAAAAALLSLAAARRGEPACGVRLSLAQTADWLMSPGPQDRAEVREVSPNPYLVTLPGANQPVQVVRPPGQLIDLEPAWDGTTEYGSDPATFAPSATGRVL